MNDAQRIAEPRVERDARGVIRRVSIAFGPHHFFEVFIENGKVHCSMGATHHGVKSDASEVNGEFEQMVDALRKAHPVRSF